MRKVKFFILFAISGFLVSQNNITFAMEHLIENIKKTIPETTQVVEPVLGVGVANVAPAGDGAGINPAGKTWGQMIIGVLIKTTIAALVAVIINPDIIKFLFSKINSKYGYELKIQQLTMINESLRIQLEQLKMHCRDKSVIQAMEATYLRSCTQLMLLQKKYLERYAN